MTRHHITYPNSLLTRPRQTEQVSYQHVSISYNANANVGVRWNAEIGQPVPGPLGDKHFARLRSFLLLRERGVAKNFKFVSVIIFCFLSHEQFCKNLHLNQTTLPS